MDFYGITFGCSLMLMNSFFVFNRFRNRSMTKKVMRPACSLVSDKLARDTLQIKLGRALGKTHLNPIHIWVKHVLPKIFWA